MMANQRSVPALSWDCLISTRWSTRLRIAIWKLSSRVVTLWPSPSTCPSLRFLRQFSPPPGAVSRGDASQSTVVALFTLQDLQDAID